MENEPFLEEDSGSRGKPRQANSKRWTAALLVISNLITFLIACAIFWYRGDLRHTEAKISGVDTKLHDVAFTALKYTPNKFSARPGPDGEADAAWASIGAAYDQFLISHTEAKDFPELTSDHAFIKPENIISGPKTDLEGYPVFIETFHQLHCLDLLRQGLFFNADYYRERKQGAWEAKPDRIQNHIEHCVDYLRQILMCHADSGVIPFHWRDSEGHVMLDIHQNRQCRNFESLQTWADPRHVNFEKFSSDLQLKPPADAVLQPPQR